MRFGARRAILATLVIAALAGCGDDPTNPPACVVGINTIDYVEPDFMLQDTNPNSATATQDVTPRTFLGEISAWYFGHST